MWGATVDDVCGVADRSAYLCRKVYESTENEFLAKAVDFLVAKPFQIAIILVVAWLANRLVRRAVRRFVNRAKDLAAPAGPLPVVDAGPAVNLRRAQRAEAIGSVLTSVATASLFTMAGLMVLGELGLNLGPLIAGAGIVGVALGFGAQTLVKDFLSGIFMLIEDQFGVEDVIEVDNGVAGRVEGLSLRVTRIRAVDGTLWHIPNGSITRVGNKSQQWSRALLDVEVAHGTDIGHAVEVIERVAQTMYRESPWEDVILEEPEIWGVEQLRETGVVIRLVVKTVPNEQWNVGRELRRRLVDSFDAEGIAIPQRTVWLRQEPAPGA